MRLLQRQTSGAPIEELCPTMRCLIVIDSSSITKRREYDAIMRSISLLIKKLRSDADLFYFMEMACVYAEDIPANNEIFDRLDRIKIPTLPDHSNTLSMETLAKAANLLIGASRQTEALGRQNLASFLVVVTKEVQFDQKPAPEVSFVWPGSPNAPWPFDLAAAMGEFGDEVLRLVDGELSWRP